MVSPSLQDPPLSLVREMELDYITEFARKFKSMELERKGGMDGERKKRGNEEGQKRVKGRRGK